MKAEDTVMNEKDIWDIQFKVIEEFKKKRKLPTTYELDKPIAQGQAEISFKAGIKEVLEWGKETCPHCIGMTYHYKRVCDTCWQSKLKEWGIE